MSMILRRKKEINCVNEEWKVSKNRYLSFSRSSRSYVTDENDAKIAV